VIAMAPWIFIEGTHITKVYRVQPTRNHPTSLVSER